ncbi:hypothetical protein EJ05DRAFT_487087 [Pseudovirgaria hyperparasitica]|uniref:Mannose-1-phosphate guanyltransferase n=1 Tax=Pseudovirgaria hyperparasitica TaxID=470096 RepID=A0A6A6W6B8_9PEZI|nr:uncharacterized protein EJ05DRAFT_487087 [Pseudovirgaria hyperparasitica]KAF2757107.1 hypothetical protein EJ05DRAFT_487087 [Pseudovirgaria hyperparasitica]
MPHATLPSPGFQALILCGPGASLNTFTSSPEDFPKALVPVANRPMVWYSIEWCIRMGVTDITLVTPPESEAAISAALSQNPHLTSLISHKPDILAPKDLTLTTGTAEMFRLPEVQAAITSDFIVLPCDLVCELDGSDLVEQWMVQEAGLGAATGGSGMPMGYGGEKHGRRGGLGVWYNTKGEGSIKGEETDFIATAPLPKPLVASPSASLRQDLANLVYTLPTDTLKDIIEEKKCLPIRHALVKKHAKTRMLTTYRDAHIYFLPFWVLEMIKNNEKFDSIAEDVLGWWAKAGWQDGLSEKLGLDNIFHRPSSADGEESFGAGGPISEQVDLTNLISTWIPSQDAPVAPKSFASRVSGAPQTLQKSSVTIPPILAYVQPQDSALPLIRRVDTAHLLLSISLRLAKLPSIAEAGKDASPFAHIAKIAHEEAIPQRCTVARETCLVAENVTVEEKCNVKESVIGAGCKIGSGARLMRCLLMDGAEVGENCQLTGCILGRRCKVEGGPAKADEKTVLKDCEVQDGFVVEWGTESKDEKFMRFEGLSDDGELEGGFDDDDGYDDEDGDDIGLS